MTNTLVVAFLVSLVCSVVVASASVLLQPLQAKNAELYRQKVILRVVGLDDPDRSIEELFAQVETRMVDLATGEYVDSPSPEGFDQRKAARDPATRVTVSRDTDIANIRTRSPWAPVYLFQEDGELQYIVLPVHGSGLWSTMYGFIALASDANTVVGLRFYEHAETPGLGAEIDNPRWLSLWPGKHVYDDTGVPRIEVIRGAVRPGAPESETIFQVDGISGATLTGNGVNNMLHYWLDASGFGPYLERMSDEADNT